ncbi:MAG: hypothetical protein D6736_02995 [Nitrospinota bacterium]|nr:MAG: hypothetical protein D6736_02995 [Nitrospinota bacterium]
MPFCFCIPKLVGGAVLFGLFLLFSFTASGGASELCLGCHERPEGEKAEWPAVINLRSFQNSVHGVLECEDCHLGFSQVPHAQEKTQVEESLRTIAERLASKAPHDPVAAAGCVTCHYETFEQVRQGVHGQALFGEKITDAPYCMDCHGSPHDIRPQTDPLSRVYYTSIPLTCARCHGDSEIIVKYKLNINVVPTYRESFHGRKLILGSSRVAVCTSCHGAHAIRDPTSSQFTAGLADTCGQCHQGATARFASAFAHIPMTEESQQIVHYTELFFSGLTSTVIIALSLHVVLDLLASLRVYITRRRRNRP